MYFLVASKKITIASAACTRARNPRSYSASHKCGELGCVGTRRLPEIQVSRWETQFFQQHAGRLEEHQHTKHFIFQQHSLPILSLHLGGQFQDQERFELQNGCLLAAGIFIVLSLNPNVVFLLNSPPILPLNRLQFFSVMFLQTIFLN